MSGQVALQRGISNAGARGQNTRMETRPLIAIFAKAPVAGRVKTRLAADLGDRAALGIYRQLLARTVARLTRPGWRTELWVTPDAAADEDGFWPALLPRKAQGAGDLGARIARALDRATEEAPVIVVGTDIPDLDAAHVRSALSALDREPIVFGPSCDGGFYLVGLRGPLPKGLFDGVPWSSPDTLARSIESAAPLTPALIGPLDDLDDRVALDRHRGEANWEAFRR